MIRPQYVLSFVLFWKRVRVKGDWEKLALDLVPRAISAFKMASGREEKLTGEEQVTCLQKYWRF